MNKKTLNVGKKRWAIPGGFIPFLSTGDEPSFTSRDWISILNTGKDEATIKLIIMFADGKPIDGYEYKVKSQRVKKIRFNDLIDPLPIPLEENYGCIIESDRNVVVQFSRMDTSRIEVSIMGTLAYTE